MESCAIRLRDIVDHVLVPRKRWPEFFSVGWQAVTGDVLRNPDGGFPDVVDGPPGIALRVECVNAFLATYGIDAKIAGAPHTPYRRARIFDTDASSVWVVERHGYAEYEMLDISATEVREARLALQRFRTRRRQFETAKRGLDHLETLVDTALRDLNPHIVCDAFFRAEREYWQMRCAAGRLQGERQQRAGIGWSNVDHHTLDCSRGHFLQTIRILEKLGYQCRELLYAGHQAGWGSQILEQPVLKSTIFADIDLTPEELGIDFAHVPLDPLPKHRRAGLWCALHGESALEAGLNHVAGLHDQAALRAQLEAAGLRMMSPFSNFPVLYQELTQGEWWPVDPTRIDKLAKDGHLAADEADDFRLRGAIGAHFENIERNAGFKGFNQPGIDGVLTIIDPRRNLGTPS